MSKIDILWYNISQLIRIMIPFTLIFIAIPVFINRNTRESLPLKITKGLTVSVFASICTGYFLSIIKLFNAFYFTIIYFPLFLVMFILIEGIPPLRGIRQWFLGMTQHSGLRTQDCIFNSNGQKPKANCPISYSNLFFIIMFICAFLFLFHLRSAPVLCHMEIYYYDIFPHMVELKNFIEGKAILGFYYPLGQEAVIGMLKLFSSCDVMDIYRIIGPVQSTLILFTLYFIVAEITNNKYIALMVTAISGADVCGIFPNVFYRQITGFHQEFAVIFLLPAVYFAVQYMTKKQGKDLVYFIISVCNTLLIHAYIALTALFLFAAIFVSGLILRQWKIKSILYILSAGTLITAIAALPVIIWSIIKKSYAVTEWSIKAATGLFKNLLKSGTSFSDVPTFIIDALHPVKDPFIWHNTASANIIIYSIVVSILYTTLRIFFRKTPSVHHVYLMVFALSQAILAIFYYGHAYNFPQSIHYERLALSLNLITFSHLGILLFEFFNIIKLLPSKLYKSFKPAGIASAGIVFIWAMIVLPQSEVPLLKLQYEGALWSYVKIRDNFPSMSWTIISPVEEYSLSSGYGYHYELCNFPEQFSMEDAENSSFNFDSRISSKHIFIYVEKNPLLIWSSLPEEGYYTKATEPYRLYSNRKKLVNYVFTWMQEYIKSHQGLSINASIFYEDKDIIVYHIVN